MEELRQFIAHRKKEDFFSASSLVANCQHLLVPIARLCLLAMFIDDGIRVALQWDDQYRYISVTWGNERFWRPAIPLIILVSIGQLVPAISILVFRRAILPSCLLLVFMVFYNSIIYHVHYDLHFLAINIAIIGGLLMLAAETQTSVEVKMTAVGGGVPQPEAPKDKKSKSLLMLAGRALLPLMFVSFLRWDPTNPIKMVELFVAAILMFLVVIGFKARLSSLALALWLVFLNLTLNAWWQLPTGHPYREFSKFDFFQTLSIIGGLLLTFAHGPGQLSLDAYNKKQW